MSHKIFYSKMLKDFVVDSMCVCGHLQRNHGSKTIRVNRVTMVREANDGSCCCGDCPCGQFTWERFVTVTEMERILFPQKKQAGRKRPSRRHAC